MSRCWCGARLREEVVRGVTLSTCHRCGPMRLPVFVPEPVTFTEAERALEQAEIQTRDCICAYCKCTFQARRVKPRRWCTEACRGAWLREQRPARKSSTKVGQRACPRCGGKRRRSAPYPKYPMGKWICDPCHRKAYHERKRRRVA